MDDPTAPLSRALRAVTAVGPPITVATALLLYFGWARTDAQARALGLDVSLFGYSPQDYILRSINSLFFPLIVIVVAAIVWNALDRALRRMLDAGRARVVIRRAALVVAGAGAVLAVALLAQSIASPRDVVLFRPYYIALGVLFAAWGIRVHRYSRRGERRPSSTEQHAVETTLVLSLVTLLMFWGTADFAGALGRRIAADYEQAVPHLPRSILYSPSPLAIDVPGVTERDVGTADAPLYRYSGLRLLVVSGGRFFFLSDGWTLATGRVTVIPDDSKVRFEFGN